MITSTWRGHEITSINDIWIYSDTNQKVSMNKNRSCGHCGKPNTREDHDGCVGMLEGIMNACCGHGIINNAYVQFRDGSVVNGINAKKIIELMRN